MSADMRQTTFGGRYVTAEDVSRCVEAFNACIHGGASAGGNPVPPTSTSSEDKATGALPQRFRISSERPIDCRLSGGTVSCTGRFQEPHGDGIYTETYEIAGTLSGMTMTGTLTGRSDSTGFCVSHTDFSAKVTYTFSPGGSVEMRQGPAEMKTTYSGGCSDSPPQSTTSPAWETTGNWSAIG